MSEFETQLEMTAEAIRSRIADLQRQAEVALKLQMRLQNELNSLQSILELTVALLEARQQYNKEFA
jgi:capsule polysaccharide export protein KpsE/RkpR